MAHDLQYITDFYLSNTSHDLGFLKWGIPKSPWVSRASHGLIVDDLGVPSFKETSMWAIENTIVDGS